MDQKIRNLFSLVNLWRMGILWVLAILWSKLLFIFTQSSETICPAGPLDMGQKLACIVTGASSGIGKATAEALALRGYYVILAGRSMLQLAKVVEEFEHQFERVSVKAMQIDLTSTASILKFKEGIENLMKAPNAPKSLQLLINNAGVLAATQRHTAEGHDYMIASNYLGHFILTQLLLPLMQKSIKPARIVNVGSFTHRCVQSAFITQQLLKESEMTMLCRAQETVAIYQMASIYEVSKLFMVLFTYELKRRHNCSTSSSQVTFMAADPGIVRTEIFKEFPKWFSTCVITCLKTVGLMQLPSAGCKAVVDAALANTDVSGKYFFGGDGHTQASSALSYDRRLAENLWNVTTEICKASLSRHRSMLEGDVDAKFFSTLDSH